MGAGIVRAALTFNYGLRKNPTPGFTPGCIPVLVPVPDVSGSHSVSLKKLFSPVLPRRSYHLGILHLTPSHSDQSALPRRVEKRKEGLVLLWKIWRNWSPL